MEEYGFACAASRIYIGNRYCIVSAHTCARSSRAARNVRAYRAFESTTRGLMCTSFPPPGRRRRPKRRAQRERVLCLCRFDFENNNVPLSASGRADARRAHLRLVRADCVPSHNIYAEQRQQQQSSRTVCVCLCVSHYDPLCVILNECARTARSSGAITKR